jgi:hypothetical protein
MHDNSGEDVQQMAKLNLTNISNKSVRLEISSTHFINPTSSMTHEKKNCSVNTSTLIYIYIYQMRNTNARLEKNNNVNMY